VIHLILLGDLLSSPHKTFPRTDYLASMDHRVRFRIDEESPCAVDDESSAEPTIPSPKRALPIRGAALRQASVYHASMLSMFSQAPRKSPTEEETSRSAVVLDQLQFLLPVIVWLTMLIGACFMMPGVFFAMDGLNLFRDTTVEVLFNLCVTSMSTFPVTMFVGWAAKQVVSGTIETKKKTGTDESSSRKWCRRASFSVSKTVILFALTITLRHTLLTLKLSVREEFESSTELVFNIASSFTIFALWLSILDDFLAEMHKYADKLESIANSTKQSDVFKSHMKCMSRFNDPSIDKGYAIPGGQRSPARVLAEVAGVYCSIAKVIGLALVFLYLIGVDVTSNIVIIGLSVVLSGLVSALHINAALYNLIPLALSNTFHVGEIISISRTGCKPGDTPVESLSGFVEGITWSSVVVRDFKRKQVFVPHKEMAETTIANWSRRPSKQVHIKLSVVPTLSGGAAPLAALSKFARKWIEEHPDIDQQTYSKSVLKLSESGQPYLEAIFYPRVGKKSREMRAEFIVMLLDASKRLNLCLLPAEVRTSTPWPDLADSATMETEESFDSETDLDYLDLLPSRELTRRAGFNPKPKKA
jgi:small-conductance mechanosensitive channel